MSQEIINAGTNLLKAYALAKAGKNRSAAELFIKVSASNDVDALMNGLAKSLLSLKASMEDEESLDGIEDDFDFSGDDESEMHSSTILINPDYSYLTGEEPEEKEDED